MARPRNCRVCGVPVKAPTTVIRAGNRALFHNGQRVASPHERVELCAPDCVRTVSTTKKVSDLLLPEKPGPVQKRARTKPLPKPAKRLPTKLRVVS